MEMIDILQKLREYEEKGHNVSDAINNVERTNPTNEGEFKKIATDKAEKDRLTKLLKDKKAEYEAAMAGQGSGVGKEEKLEDEIEEIEKSLGIKREGKEMKKETVKESITMTADTPQEASILMQILKLAGIEQKPVDDQMINQPSEQEGCGCDNNCSCGGNCGADCDCENCSKAEETYANEPDTKTQDTDTLVNFHSGGLNRQKQTFPKVAGGDNPMQPAKEDLSDSLRKQYDEFKANYQEAVNEAKKAKSPYAVGMAQAMKATGDKPPLEKATIKKAHDIAKAVKKGK
jgi:hypothetical protein